MSRGITESDVHTAADELVARGERPTVQRIRAHLGAGSPNAVTRWLETWWNKLAAHLEPPHPPSESAPDALMELAGERCELAMNHARKVALQELAAAEQSLTEVAAERIATAQATELPTDSESL